MRHVFNIEIELEANLLGTFPTRTGRLASYGPRYLKLLLPLQIKGIAQSQVS